MEEFISSQLMSSIWSDGTFGGYKSKCFGWQLNLHGWNSWGTDLSIVGEKLEYRFGAQKSPKSLCTLGVCLIWSKVESEIRVLCREVPLHTYRESYVRLYSVE